MFAHTCGTQARGDRLVGGHPTASRWWRPRYRLCYGTGQSEEGLELKEEKESTLGKENQEQQL